MSLRQLFAILALSTLVACASSPQKSAGSDRYQRSHQRHAHAQQRPKINYYICPGMGVSNAPSSDAKRRIINFDPYADIHGARIARAPVKACFSSGYGPRRGGAGSFHHGIDLYTRTPKPIHASGDGVIESVTTMRGYGRTVVIRHNNRVKTRYAHLSSYASGLRAGKRVRLGDIIGNTGRTGNAQAVHLHYEVLVNGRQYNPMTIGS